MLVYFLLSYSSSYLLYPVPIINAVPVLCSSHQ